MAGAVTFVNMPRSKPKTSAEGKEQLSSSLARMASTSGSGRGVPIIEVGFGQCRFVIDDRSFPALCCGEPTLGGSWCAQHRALVFVRVAVQANGRRPAEIPAKAAGEPATTPIQRPMPPGANSAVAASPSPVKAAKAPPAVTSASHAKQKPELVAAPHKAAAQKEPATPAKVIKQAAAALKGSSTAPSRSDAGQKGAVKSTSAKATGAKSMRAREGMAASAKSRVAGRSGATKKAGAAAKAAAAKQGAVKKAAAKSGAAKKLAKLKKPAPAKSKKLAAKRPSSVKKAAAPHKRTAKRAASPKKATASSKRGARKKAG